MLIFFRSFFFIFSFVSPFCFGGDCSPQKPILDCKNDKKRLREENVIEQIDKKMPSVRALIMEKMEAGCLLEIHDFDYIDEFFEEAQSILAEENKFYEVLAEFLFKVSQGLSDVLRKEKARFTLANEARRSVLSDLCEQNREKMFHFANGILHEKSSHLKDFKKIMEKLKDCFLSSSQEVESIVDYLKKQKTWTADECVRVLDSFLSIEGDDRKKILASTKKIIKSQNWNPTSEEFSGLLKVVCEKTFLKERPLSFENDVCVYSFREIISAMKGVVSAENYTPQGFVGVMQALMEASFADLETMDYATYVFDNKKYNINDLVSAIKILGAIPVKHQANTYLIVENLVNDRMLSIPDILNFLEKYIAIFFKQDKKALFSINDLSDVIVTLYKKTKRYFYKFLYSEFPQSNENFEENDKNKINLSSFFFIYNQDGYKEKQKNICEKDIKGNRINFFYKKNIYSIGYSIYFHENLKEMSNVEAIKVTVYGGETKFDHDSKRIFKRKKLSFEENYFTNKNIILINLDLPDLLQETHQSSMTLNFANLLQTGIHHFWETIKYSPELIHKELENLKEKNVPMYLSGSSFGALMVSYQADRYPGTWTGYIAQDAFLCTDENKKYDLVDSGSIYSLGPCNIMNLKDPMLITGNAHDNNVNMRHWPSFYKKAQEANKQDLIYSWYFYKGTTEISECLSDTGHYAPKTLIELNKYCEVLQNFMLNRAGMYSEKKIVKMNPTLTSEQASQWINAKGLIKSYENDISASADELFLAETYAQSKKNPLISKEDLQKIFTVFFIIKHKKNQKILNNIFNKASKKHFENGVKRDYQAWWNFAQSYVEKIIAETSYTHRAKGGPDLDFIPYLADVYKDFLSDVVFSYNPYTARRDKISFIRAIRSFLVPNTDLLKHVHPKTLKTAGAHFQNAYKKWMDWKRSMTLLVPNHPILKAQNLS